MVSLVIRISAALQSWSGYRHLAKMGSVVPTESVPRKSAVNGLIGASIGVVDRGFGCARNLDEIGSRYELQVRVDARNPATEDFQVVGEIGNATATAARSHMLATASTAKFPSKRGGGNFPTEVAEREFLSFSEFVVAFQTDRSTADAWSSSLRDPAFMPYFGRRSCAPTFPFVLGVFERSIPELFGELPFTDKYNASGALFGYTVTGNYNVHHAEAHAQTYAPPIASRHEQLTWVKENLR